MNDFDIGKDLQDAYNEGYIDALTDFENKIDAELTKACWYSKGRILGLIECFKGECRIEEFSESD